MNGITNSPHPEYVTIDSTRIITKKKKKKRNTVKTRDNKCLLYLLSQCLLPYVLNGS